MSSEETLGGIPGLTDVGWIPPTGMGHISLPTFGNMFGSVKKAASAYEWALGDMTNWGEAVYGEDFYALLDESDYEDRSIYRLQRVAAFYPHSERVPGFSPWKAEIMMKASPPVREEILRIAKTRPVTANEVRQRKDADEGLDRAELIPHSETCPWCGAPSMYWQDAPATRPPGEAAS